MLKLAHYRKAARYLRPYWPVAVGSVATTLFATGFNLLAPWPMKVLVDSVMSDKPLPGAIQWVAALLPGKTELLAATVVAGFLLVVAVNGLGIAEEYLATKLDLAMALDFRSDLFQQAQRLSMSYHDQRRSGMVIYVINSMAGAATRVVMSALPIVQNVLMLFGMLWVSIRINPRLALLSLTIVPFVYYSIGYYTSHIQKNLVAVKALEGESLGIIHEAISMLRVIVAFGGEEFERKKFREQGLRALGARIDVTLRQTIFSLAVNTTTAAGTALVLGYGTRQVMQQQLTIGELLIVLAYIGSVYKPIESLSSTIGNLQDQFVSLQIAFDFLEKEPEIHDAPGAVALERTSGHVRFESVNFRYEGRDPVLRDISFEALPGRAIAIVGQTGAGKSSLVSLLPRFYDPYDGRILLDGVDIRQLTLKSLRRHVSIVLQEPLLFSSTIDENIRYGRPGATEADVIEAAKAANAHDFIAALPEGYRTQLGERGAKLSGGERQRIAVARAFLKNAPILILDEPTSSIDSKTEAVILDALDHLMVGRTTFVIAHRLSTIRHVDMILVLHKGAIVERGSHDELLAGNGMYRQLYDMQTGRFRGAVYAPRPAM